MNTQKQITLMVVLVFLLAGSCAAYTAIDLPYRADKQQEYLTDESIERGALLFANNCRTCHGDRGQGGIGLPLNTDTYKDQDPLTLKANRDKLRRTLYCGRVGTFMQPWIAQNGGSLNGIQIEHIIDLITAPLNPDVLDEQGNPISEGWEHALEFSHNLNREGSAVVGGDTLATIAKSHQIGYAEVKALNPGLEMDQVLKKGTKVKLPPNTRFPKGRTYKVTQGNETLAKIVDAQHVGAAILADLNGIPFKLDTKKSLFTIHSETGAEIPGIFPTIDSAGKPIGTDPVRLKLPDGAVYVVSPGDKLETIAARHRISVADIQNLNDSVRSLSATEDLKADPPLVLKLPKVDALEIKGQTLSEVAQGFASVTAASLAAAQGQANITADVVLRIGQTLKLPPDAWGVAPAGTPNDGKACVENAVPQSVFGVITGAVKEPEQPATASTTVSVAANANDWTLTADGKAQAPNKGTALVAKGTAVEFSVNAGLHTVTLNGKKDNGDIKPNDKRTLTFNEAGKFKITCDYHPDMLAYIWVQ